MKSFFKVFIVLLFIFSVLNANEYKDIKTVSLKKDETQKIIVKYGSLEKLFKFRWTLYNNGGLVIFRSYDQIVAQNILYLRYKNQSVRIELKPRGADFYNVPYFLVKFEKFDYEKNEAVFKIFLSDTKDQIKLKYLKNE